MNTLELQVLRLIGESIDSPDVFTDDSEGLALVRGSVNDAIQEICLYTGSYTRSYHLALLENRIFYRIDPVVDHFGYVVECWDTEQHYKLEQTSLIRLNSEDPIWMQQVGPQLKYMQLGWNYIGIYMAPSAKGKVLDLRCVCIPKAYALDTDPIKVRESFQRAAVHLGVSEFYASRGDASRANEWFQKYLEVSGMAVLNPKTEERQWQFRGGPANAAN